MNLSLSRVPRRHHSCYDMEGWGWDRGRATEGGEQNRDIIRFMEVELSRLKVFVLNEAAQFVIWRLRLHFICNWNWRIAPSVNITEERLIQRGRRSIPGSSLAQTLEVISRGFDIDADELWRKKSCLWRALSWRLNRMSCCVFPLGLEATGAGAAATASVGCLCKTAWICVPAWDRKRQNESCCSEANVSKPVDGAVCGSLSPLQPSATWTTWTSMQQWWDVTGGISPGGASKRTEKLKMSYKNMQTCLFLAYIYIHKCWI